MFRRSDLQDKGRLENRTKQSGRLMAIKNWIMKLLPYDVIFVTSLKNNKREIFTQYFIL